MATNAAAQPPRLPARPPRSLPVLLKLFTYFSVSVSKFENMPADGRRVLVCRSHVAARKL